MGEGWGLHPAVLALPAPAAPRPSEPHILVLLVPDGERLGPQGSEEAEAQGQEQGLHAGSVLAAAGRGLSGLEWLCCFLTPRPLYCSGQALGNLAQSTHQSFPGH